MPLLLFYGIFAVVICVLILAIELFSCAANGCRCPSCCCHCRRRMSRGMRASSKPDVLRSRRLGLFSRWKTRHDRQKEVTLASGLQDFSAWPSGVKRGGRPVEGEAPSVLFQKKRRSKFGGRFASKALTPGFFFHWTSNPLPPYAGHDLNPYFLPDPAEGLVCTGEGGEDLTPDMVARMQPSPEELARVTMSHLGKPKVPMSPRDVIEIEWVPHVASRLRRARMLDVTDVDCFEKQKQTVLQGWIDETVVKVVLAAHPTEIVTASQVSRWYSANNTLLLSADPDVRLLTALFVERYSTARLRSLRDFTSRPDGE